MINQHITFIKPESIYGFCPSTGTLEDHPDFKNPRTKINRDIINQIKESGTILTAIVLHETSNGTVVIDGKTRLLAVAEYKAENPDSDAFDTIPVVYLEDQCSDDEAYGLMCSLNVDRDTLSQEDIARFLVSLDDRGITEEEQCRILHKTGRAGLRWIREAKQAINNEAINEALSEGIIEDFVTAKHMAVDASKEDDPAQAAKEMIDKLVELKNSGVSEKEAKQKTTSRGPNKTSLNYKQLIADVEDWYPEAKLALMKVYGEDLNFTYDVNIEDEQEVEKHLDYIRLVERFDVYMYILKMKGHSLFDTISNLEQELSIECIAEANTKCGHWMPKQPKKKNKET